MADEEPIKLDDNNALITIVREPQKMLVNLDKLIEEEANLVLQLQAKRDLIAVLRLKGIETAAETVARKAAITADKQANASQPEPVNL